jgi:hypothetical protein
MFKTAKIAARVPADVKTWLIQQANYHGSSIGAEISRSCRERQEREIAAARDRPPPAKADAVAGE